MKKTLILRVNPQHPEIERIRIAASLIKKGRLVAFPTETVYGLGADALNPKAVGSLFTAKNRPLDNPPIVHVGRVEDVLKLAEEIPSEAERLMKLFWPGPLTLILKRSKIVPDITVAGLDTIALRMPRHPVALALISESRRCISAPSANLAGKPSPTSIEHVLDDLGGRIDAVLDGGSTQIGVESTVLDLTVHPPLVLRPGGTSFERLRKILEGVELHPVAIADMEPHVEKTPSPGLKHKHYAPEADVILVEGESPATAKKVADLVKLFTEKGFKVGVMATDETVELIGSAATAKSLGSKEDLSLVAKNLFALLREFDSEGFEVIIAEGVPTRGIGLAIMNRLRKASGYKIVKV